MTLRNASFQASAGTGKTWQVTHLYAAMILGREFRSGSGEEVIFAGDALDCRDILMLTFARNAAAEMRTRIAAQIETELTRAEVTEKPRYWNLLRSLAGAHISTIHSFAQRLITEHALLAGVSPGMSVLDETVADEMFTERIEQALLAELKKRGEKRADTLRMLCRACGLTQEFGNSGVADVIKALIQKARARNLQFRDIGTLIAVPSAPCRRDLQKILEAVRKAVDAYPGTCSTGSRLVRELDAALRAPGAGARPEEIAFIAANRVAEISLQGLTGDKSLAVKAVLNEARAALQKIAAYPASLEARRHLEQFLPFVQHCMNLYQESKQEPGWFDYDDLILKALALVREHGETVSHFKAIIVDEAQDNARIQNEFVDELAKASGAAVILCGDWKQSIHTWRAADPGGMQKLAARRTDRVDVPLKTSFRSQKDLVHWINSAVRRDIVLGEQYGEPDKLEPRDLAQTTAGPNVEILLSPWEYGGQLDEQVQIQETRATAKKEGKADWLRFELTGNALKKMIPEEGGASEWEKLAERYEKRITLEARAVARRIRLLCDSSDSSWRPKWIWDDSAERWVEANRRRYHCRDILILLRASSRQEVYETALREAGIRYTTDGKGKGFYYRQEVQDICSLVAWLAWPYDDVSLVALLRSPFVALSDPAIAVLAASSRPRGEALRRAVTAEEKRAERLAADLERRNLRDDAQVYRQANRVLRRMRNLAGRLTAVELVREAITLTGFDAAMAGQFHGIQKLANMRKLLSVIQDMERRENLDLQALAKWLTRQLNSTAAPDAVVFDPEDDAVRISTVHAAKGLTSPVVILPDLRRGIRRDNLWCQLEDLEDGRSRVAARIPQCERTGEKVEYASCNQEAASTAGREREDGEARRLFYVAITRPRDLLILSGETMTDKQKTTWRSWVNENIRILLCEGTADQLMTVRSYGSVDTAYRELTSPAGGGRGQVTLAEMDAAVSNVRQPAVPERYRLPVTTLTGVPTASLDGVEPLEALMEYRRTRLVGLAPAWMRARNGDDAEETGPAVDYAEIGTQGHAVLEVFDYRSEAPVAERVRLAMQTVGLGGQTAADLEPRLLEVAEHLAAELRGAAHIITELPFVARFEHDKAVCLVDGKIDLLYFKDGAWHIVDYKFSGADRAKLLKDYSLQLEIYREAISNVDSAGTRHVNLVEEQGPAPVRLQLLGIGNTGRLEVVDVETERTAEQVATAVVTAARTLSAELGRPAKPGWNCPF